MEVLAQVSWRILNCYESRRIARTVMSKAELLKLVRIMASVELVMIVAHIELVITREVLRDNNDKRKTDD